MLLILEVHPGLGEVVLDRHGRNAFVRHLLPGRNRSPGTREPVPKRPHRTIRHLPSGSYRIGEVGVGEPRCGRDAPLPPELAVDAAERGADDELGQLTTERVVE